jgi:ribosomal protein L7Ae-like RNA K-turn-binding protein
MLGLACRAGKVVSGEFSVERAVRKHKAKLVIVAGDASENTRSSFTDLCAYYKVPVCIYATREALGAFTGKGFRASAAVLDDNFANTIKKLVEEEIQKNLEG